MNKIKDWSLLLFNVSTNKIERMKQDYPSCEFNSMFNGLIVNFHSKVAFDEFIADELEV